MIKEIREKEPFIHLGFNRQTIKAKVGVPVELWQDTIYKADEYSEPFVLAPSAFITKVSNNKYILSFTTTGAKTCRFTTTGTGAKVLESNDVIVEVEAITWASEDIFFNNEYVTFNSI